MKKKLSLLFTTLVLIGMFRPGLGQAALFSDVSSSYKHSKAIASLAEKGLISGYTDRTFRPDEIITRVEAVAVLAKDRFDELVIARVLDDHRAKKHFYVESPDVGINDWFAPYVKIAFLNDIVHAYPDKMFKPKNPVNFAEGLKMIFSTYKINLRVPFGTSRLLLVNERDWFAPYFIYAKNKGLINADKFYHPAQLMTRGEFAEIVYRLQEIQSKRLTHYSSAYSAGSNEYVITVPRLNLIKQRVEFADPYNKNKALMVLRRAPFGHYLAKPGSGKKFVLFGHSSGYAWDKSPFKVVLRQINELRVGDKIYINYQERGYVYAVSKTEIIPETQDTTILANESANELVIYTCWPPDSIKQRYVVYGRPI